MWVNPNTEEKFQSENFRSLFKNEAKKEKYISNNVLVSNKEYTYIYTYIYELIQPLLCRLTFCKTVKKTLYFHNILLYTNVILNDGGVKEIFMNSCQSEVTMKRNCLEESRKKKYPKNPREHKAMANFQKTKE